MSSQLGSPYQGDRYGTEKAGGTAYPSRTKSHLLGHSLLASQTEGEKVTGTGRRKGRKRIGQDGSTDSYTVVTGTGREKD